MWPLQACDPPPVLAGQPDFGATGGLSSASQMGAECILVMTMGIPGDVGEMGAGALLFVPRTPP